MYNDHLVLIIQSLTPREKADFKRYLNFKSGNRIPKHEILFDLYNKYSSKKLSIDDFTNRTKKALSKHPEVSKDLANIRNQLKERLLESLVIQSTAKNIKFEIDQSIKSIEVLINRKLFTVASLEIRQAKKRAKAYDLNKPLANLIGLELILLTQQSSAKDQLLLERLINKQQAYLNLHHVELELRNLFRSLNLLAEKNMQLTKQESQLEFRKIFQSSFFKNFKIEPFLKQENVHIISWYYRIKNLYYRCIGEAALAFKYSKKLVSFFESDKTLIDNFESLYVKALCSFGRACSACLEFNELNKIIPRVKEIYQFKKNFNAHEALCDMGVLHYLETAQYEKATEISDLMDTTWQQLKTKTIDGKLLWYAHSNAILYLIIGNNEKFNFWLNKGLNISRPKKGRHIYLGLRILELVYLYNNNQFFTFKEKIEACQKTLQYNQNLNQFETIVLQHFRKFYNIHNSNKNLNLKKNERTKLELENFESLKNALLKLTYKLPPANYEEILLWCESRLQNKSIKVVFENRNH